MRTRLFLSFASKVMAAHVITYFLAGTIAYPLQPEVILQGLALGAILALWMGPPSPAKLTR